ncbi:MAG: hypothetical protein JW808_10825 [Victivallales bacterium]|nr:hypothetical protein [Victivallales bacterium]
MPLKLKNDSGKTSGSNSFEAGQLHRGVAEIERKIAEIEEEFKAKSDELSKERNYEPWFYIALGIGVLFFLFKLTFSSFFLAAFLGGLVYLYKKFLHKDVRILEMQKVHEKNLELQRQLLGQRRKELDTLENNQN